MEWKTVSTLLFSDREECEYLNSVCVCVCLWAFMCLNVFQEREWRKEREANGGGQAEPRNQPLPPHHRRTAWSEPSPHQDPSALYLGALPPPSPLFLSRPCPLSEAPLPLTAHPPQTRRSVCASCSQSQSRSQSYVCRCLWCRCRWSQSEWWRRRTSRRRPMKDQ